MLTEQYPAAAFEIPTSGGGHISRKWLLFFKKAKADIAGAGAWVVAIANGQYLIIIYSINVLF